MEGRKENIQALEMSYFSHRLKLVVRMAQDMEKEGKDKLGIVSILISSHLCTRGSRPNQFIPFSVLMNIKISRDNISARRRHPGCPKTRWSDLIPG